MSEVEAMCNLIREYQVAGDAIDAIAKMPDTILDDWVALEGYVAELDAKRDVLTGEGWVPGYVAR